MNVRVDPIALSEQARAARNADEHAGYVSARRRRRRAMRSNTTITAGAWFGVLLLAFGVSTWLLILPLCTWSVLGLQTGSVRGSPQGAAFGTAILALFGGAGLLTITRSRAQRGELRAGIATWLYFSLLVIGCVVTVAMGVA